MAFAIDTNSIIALAFDMHDHDSTSSIPVPVGLSFSTSDRRKIQFLLTKNNFR